MRPARHVALGLLALPVAATGAWAEGYSCAFDQYCAGIAPCVVLATPKVVEFSKTAIGFEARENGYELAEAPFRIVEEAGGNGALFLTGEQDWAQGAERWLVSILPDGPVRMTKHSTIAFGEFETHLGMCEVTE
ncbi:hypothetical protein [Halovulum sp. GXIMD14793]